MSNNLEALEELYDRYKLDGDIEALFLLYYYGCLVTGDTEPNMVMMPSIADAYNFDYDTRLWMAWLWGNFNTLPPVIQVAETFPHPTELSYKEFAKWCVKYGNGLVYAGDRTYVRGHLLEMYDSYIEMLEGSTQAEFFSRHCRKKPIENFHSLWGKLVGLRGFATYSAYEMSEVLYRCTGLNITADRIFFKTTRSPRAGLSYVVSNGASSLVISKSKSPTNAEAQVMEDQAFEWVIRSRALFPQTWPDMWSLESALCTFKKCFTGRRYVGFLLDRSANELYRTELTGFHLPILWDVRRKLFPREYLVELRGGKGPEEEKLWRLRDRRELAGLDLGLLESISPIYGRTNKGVFCT